MHGTFTVASVGMPTTALMVSRPTHATFVRRRLVVLVFLVTLLLSFGLAARHGLADRGVGPASDSTAGRTSALAAVPGVLADGTYLVQPGDSLWTIASKVYDGPSLADYVDALVSLHGGSVITPGERIRLP